MDAFLALASCCFPPKQFLWDEYPGGDFDISTSEYSNTQFVNVHFIDLGESVEEIGESVVDAKLPYERIQFTENEVFRAATNHMVGFCSVCRKPNDTNIWAWILTIYRN